MSEICLSEEKFACDEFAYVSTKSVPEPIECTSHGTASPVGGWRVSALTTASPAQQNCSHTAGCAAPGAQRAARSGPGHRISRICHISIWPRGQFASFERRCISSSPMSLWRPCREWLVAATPVYLPKLGACPKRALLSATFDPSRAYFGSAFCAPGSRDVPTINSNDRTRRLRRLRRPSRLGLTGVAREGGLGAGACPRSASTDAMLE